MSSNRAGWALVAGLGLGMLLATAALFFFLAETWQTAIAGLMAGVGLLLAFLGGWRTLRARQAAPATTEIPA